LFYYLETNAIIQLESQILEIHNINKCYTSCLSILELIKNLNDKNFNRQKQRLTWIKESGLKIDWSFIYSKIAYSYGFSVKDVFQSGLKHVYSLILNNYTLQDLLCDPDSKETLDWVDAFSFQANSEVRSSMNNIANQSITKNQYPSRKRKAVIKFVESKFPQMKALVDNQDVNIRLFANTARRAANKENCLSIDDVAKRYNHLLDYFLIASGEYFQNMFREDWAIKKNDLLDICHFIYLQKSSVMVSNDQRILMVSRKILGNKKAFTVDDFKYKMSIPS